MQPGKGQSFQREVQEPVGLDSIGAEVSSWLFRRPALDGSTNRRLVILHGLGDAPVTWFAAVRGAFASHEIVLPALPGAGRGPLPEGHSYLTNSSTTDWYGAVLAGLAKDGNQTTLVGHSFGGWITMRALLRVPKLAQQFGAPILINTAGTWYDGVERERALLSPRQIEDVDELLDHVYHETPQIPPVALQAMLDTMRSSSYRDLVRSTTRDDFLDATRLAALPRGTGVIWGLSDRLVPAAALHALRAHLVEPRIIEIADCGHAPHIERPKALTDAMGRLLV